MEIKDFTGSSIRIGQYPHCIDVTNIPNYHSSYGIVCSLFDYAYNDDMKPRIMLIRSLRKGFMYLVVMKYIEQFDDLHEEIRNGVIVFDSYSTERKE